MIDRTGEGRPMVEILNLKSEDEEPKGSSWVCIEKKGDLYFLIGRANGEVVDPHVSPDGLPTAEAAIRAAMVWADYLGAAVIYVRDER
jgi:hypothetical protein